MLVRITGRVYTIEGWVKPGPRVAFVDRDLPAEEAQRLVDMFPERVSFVSPGEEKRDKFPKRGMDRAVRSTMTR